MSIQSINNQDRKLELSNVRIIQRNLVYLIGIPLEIAKNEILMKQEFLGQYGKITKLIVNKPQIQGPNKNQYSVYVTFLNEKNAIICRLALEEFKYKNSVIKANFGTTKYCNNFISKQKCLNQDCLYLHTKQTQQDVYTQDTVQQGIKNLNQKQQEHFIKNIDLFKNDKVEMEKNYEFPSFLSYLQKKQNIINIFNKKQENKNKTNDAYYDQEQDFFSYLKDIFEFESVLDKSIVQQFLNKSSKNPCSRYNFAIDNDSTESSSIEQETGKSLLIQIFDLQNHNTNKRISFQFLTGNGKLNKSLKKINLFAE